MWTVDDSNNEKQFIMSHVTHFFLKRYKKKKNLYTSQVWWIVLICLNMTKVVLVEKSSKPFRVT